MSWISLVVSVVAVIVAITTFILNNKWERKRATIEAYKDLQGELFCIYEYEAAEEIELFVTDPRSEEYKVLSTALASIESFAICVFNETYDKDMAYKLAHGFIDGTLREKIECMLEMKRRKSGKDYYSNTSRLLDWMDMKSR